MNQVPVCMYLLFPAISFVPGCKKSGPFPNNSVPENIENQTAPVTRFQFRVISQEADKIDELYESVKDRKTSNIVFNLSQQNLLNSAFPRMHNGQYLELDLRASPEEGKQFIIFGNPKNSTAMSLTNGSDSPLSNAEIIAGIAGILSVSAASVLLLKKFFSSSKSAPDIQDLPSGKKVVLAKNSDSVLDSLPPKSPEVNAGYYNRWQDHIGTPSKPVYFDDPDEFRAIL